MLRANTFWAIVAMLLPSAANADAADVKAVPPKYEISGSRQAVLTAIDGCVAEMACPLLSDFKAAAPKAYYWLQAWCRSEKAGGASMDPGKPFGRACGAIIADTHEKLEEVPSTDLQALRHRIAAATCAGFGLTVPLYSIRHVGSGTVANGPIKAGLGGGYFFGEQLAGVCRETFAAGPEAFVWSEGLDPSGLFHVGIAAGYQLSAFKYFSFGAALGYDVYRSDKTTAQGQTNGLLSGKHLGKGSFTWLLTVSFTSTAGSTSNPESTSAAP